MCSVQSKHIAGEYLKLDLQLQFWMWLPRFSCTRLWKTRSYLVPGEMKICDQENRKILITNKRLVNAFECCVTYWSSNQSSKKQCVIHIVCRIIEFRMRKLFRMNILVIFNHILILTDYVPLQLIAEIEHLNCNRKNVIIFHVIFIHHS